MSGHPRRLCHARHQRRQIAMILKRVARRHQPPNDIEPEPAHRDQADLAVRGMSWIKAAAQESDPQTTGVARQAHENRR